jgi:hypothetical protein
MIEDGYSSDEIVLLMSSVYKYFDKKLPDIQFELGKCISEMVSIYLSNYLTN